MDQIKTGLWQIPYFDKICPLCSQTQLSGLKNIQTIPYITKKVNQLSVGHSRIFFNIF